VRPHAFNIFGSAVFRVALRIGTKLVDNDRAAAKMSSRVASLLVFNLRAQL
jgi:hypothetical protein